MKIIVIAGPQASGKTTVWRFLSDKYGGRAGFYEEMNPYVLFPEKARLGSVVVDAEMEKKIHEADVARIGEVLKEGMVGVIETLMFHAVYYEEFLGKEFYHQGMRDYEKALREVEVGVLFIDTTPEVSFARRRGEYWWRVVREIERRGLKGEEARRWGEEMMKKYETRMKDRYQKWWQVFEELDYVKEKWVIENNDRSRGSFLNEVEKVFLSWL